MYYNTDSEKGRERITMLLTDILAKDIEHCDGAIREDEKLRDMETEFYRLGEGIDKNGIHVCGLLCKADKNCLFTRTEGFSGIASYAKGGHGRYSDTADRLRTSSDLWKRGLSGNR